MGSTYYTFIMRWSTAALLVVSVGADQVKYPIIKAWTKHTAKSESDTMLTREPRNAHNHAQQNGYGAPEKEEEVVDLHNKEFCVDVSTFQEVVWVERDGEMCKTDFVKQCEQKSENVCADVTETRRQVVPYTECEMGEESQEFTETKFEPKLFVEKHCTTGQRTIPHQKFLPECRDVTKQNCVTLWETDADGKQVWAGTDACEPVTWKECKLVPKDVQFIVPDIKCSDKQELWYHEPEPTTSTRRTNTFGCKAKSTTDCKTQTRPDCKTISWHECREVPVTKCEPKSVHIPTQERLHRKKCLLPDEEPLPTYSEAPQPNYSG